VPFHVEFNRLEEHGFGMNAEWTDIIPSTARKQEAAK